MKKLTLLSDPPTINSALEVWYIQNRLLDGLPFTLTQDAGSLVGGVVVYLELGGADLSLIELLKSRSNRVVLFQMGDEYGRKTREAYDLCDGVIKNYYFKDIADEPRWQGRMHWAPNGFKSGVGPRAPERLKPTAERSFLAAFMGWLNNAGSYHDERKRFEEQIEACKPHLFVNPSAGFSGGFNVGLYAAVLESSLFCPCPAGNSPETIRLYDVLEAGCIPISLRHEFMDAPHALGGVPFPVIDSWADLPAFLAQQQVIREREPHRLAALQRRCVDWWQRRQSEISGDIGQFLFELRTRP